jgi:decaprenyl-phosphate phosphoribosyltransferase
LTTNVPASDVDAVISGMTTTDQPFERVLPAQRSAPATLAALVRACRPRQWAKNVMVLAAPVAAGLAFQPRVVAEVGMAVVAFILASSGIYLVNDIVDVEADRAHDTKRLRPVASGRLAPAEASVAAVVLLAAGLIVSALVTWQLLAVVGLFEAIQLWYCLGMKNEPVIELVSVASGFLLRAIAGGVATHVALSSWFLVAAGFGALFIAAGKRYAEMLLAQRTTAIIRPVLAGYTPTYLRFVWTLSAGVLVTTYALWASTVHQPASNGWSTASILPFVMALLRYGVDVDMGNGGEPEEILYHDRVLLLLILVWAACFVASAYS